MDPELLATVRVQLERSGYKDIPDSILEEFTRRLQQDDEFAFSSTAPPVEDSPPKPVHKPRVVLERPPSPPEPQSHEAKQPAAGENVPANTSIRHKRSPTKQANQDDELASWSKRIQGIQAKAKTLDSQIQECRSVIADSPVKPHEVDVGLYFGTAGRPLDPYPTVKKNHAGGGGFIRPPPIRASRKPAGPKKSSGRRLLYEERFPDYVPGPEQRRDALRWEIRKKLAYSDPQYRQ
jgi:hypothetical protein